MHIYANYKKYAIIVKIPSRNPIKIIFEGGPEILDILGNLIEALATGLMVKQPKEMKTETFLFTGIVSEHRKVPPATSESFKDRLHSLYKRLRSLQEGETILYAYNNGENGANEELATVLEKLPKLEEGSSYVFPDNTYLVFSSKGKNAEGKVEIEIGMSNWIRTAYLQMKE